METQAVARQFKLGLILIITLSISAGCLGMAAFAEWLRGNASYALHGAVAALFLWVIIVHARKLFRLVS